MLIDWPHQLSLKLVLWWWRDHWQLDRAIGPEFIREQVLERASPAVARIQSSTKLRVHAPECGRNGTELVLGVVLGSLVGGREVDKGSLLDPWRDGDGRDPDT
eukprot:TRINITY_DN2205_c0_g1_i3.p1 TRINITY_DN2205_c0_g1~~TRINITY_DN2205_c0_g1_i3.p1  ORF type:complete len:103 (-),score=22.43 TRINITY_DN2205_c0_g1_i3:340-648(-)